MNQLIEHLELISKNGKCKEKALKLLNGIPSRNLDVYYWLKICKVAKNEEIV